MLSKCLGEKKNLFLLHKHFAEHFLTGIFKKHLFIYLFKPFPFVNIISCALLGTYCSHVPYTWLQTSCNVYMWRLHGWVTPCYFVGGPTERCYTSPGWFRPGEEKTGDRGPSAEHGNNLRGSCRYVSSGITRSTYSGVVSANALHIKLPVFPFMRSSQGYKFISQSYFAFHECIANN